MTIALETILALLGALLLLTAIIGGGFEIKSAKIPKVGVGGRIVSFVVGLFCLVLAIGIAPGLDDDVLAEETTEPAEPVQEEPEVIFEVNEATPPPPPPREPPPPPPLGGPPPLP